MKNKSGMQGVKRTTGRNTSSQKKTASTKTNIKSTAKPSASREYWKSSNMLYPDPAVIVTCRDQKGNDNAITNRHRYKRKKVMKKDTKENYIYGIDGLRTMAVLMIFAYHCMLGFAKGGLLGVTVFFAISGYLITSILLKELDETNGIDLKKFWVKRLKRIMPAVLTMLAVLIFVSAIVNRVLFTKACKDILSVVFYYNNWWQIFNNVSYFENAGAPSPLTHCWSLAIEMQIYLILPLILIAFYKFKKPKNIMVGCTSVLAILSVVLMWVMFDPSKDPSRVYFGTDTRAFSLLLGALLAMLTKNKLQHSANNIIRYAKDILGTISLIGLLIMMVAIDGYSSFLFHGGQLLASLFTIAIIYAVSDENSILGKGLSIKPFSWISERSYGIYLWHFPIILLISNGQKAQVWVVLVELLLSFVCAELSYRFIERPVRSGDYKKYKWMTPVVTGIAVAVFVCIIFVPKENMVSNIQEKEAEAEEVQNIAQQKLEEQREKASEAIECISEETEATEIVTEPVTEEASETLSEEIESEATEELNEQEVVVEEPEEEVIEEPVEEPVPEVVPEAAPMYEFSEEENAFLQSLNLLLLGDSVSVSAADEFYEAFPNGICDAAVSRYTTESYNIYRDVYAAQGWNGNGVIFALGSNGVMYDSLPELRNRIGENQIMFVFTVRAPHVSWEGTNNEEIRGFVNNTPNTYLVDWYAASEGHSEYFISDGTHLTQVGQTAFINCLKKAVLDVYR